MFKRIVFALLVLLIAHGVASSPSAAQTADPCVLQNAWAFGEGPWPFGWWYFASLPGPFSYLIAAYKATCHPQPECSTCPAGGNPIFLTNGDTYVEDKDVSVPGLGGGLNLTRHWNSVWPQKEITSSIGIFGPNWRSTYEERVFMGSDNWVKYARGDGNYWSFGVGGAGTFAVASPANISASLTQTVSSLVLTFQNGEQRQFNVTTGLLNAIIDRNGNTTQLSYDSSNRLITVTSPASQHLYFNYGTGSSSNLVTSVTSDFGVTLSYGYDAQGRLIQVTKPDQTTVSYTYNSLSQITSVTDNNGKVLESHTYDSSGRGLTSSQANGVNALTVTYPQ